MYWYFDSVCLVVSFRTHTCGRSHDLTVRRTGRSARVFSAQMWQLSSKYIKPLFISFGLLQKYYKYPIHCIIIMFQCHTRIFQISFSKYVFLFPLSAVAQFSFWFAVRVEKVLINCFPPVLGDVLSIQRGTVKVDVFFSFLLTLCFVFFPHF